MAYAGRVEYVRKGVERVNGVVKGRFRFFMLPIMLQSSPCIDDLFCFACALHNWRLNNDGLDTFWDTAEHWRASKHESGESLDEGMGKGSTLQYREGNKTVTIKPGDDFSRLGTDHFGDVRMLHESSTAEGQNVLEEEIEDSFFIRRKKIVDHLAYTSKTTIPEHRLDKKLLFRDYSKEYRNWWAKKGKNGNIEEGESEDDS